MRKTFLALALGLLAFAFHYPFANQAAGISRLDCANYNFPLFAVLSDYLRGHWTPYTFNLGYGGTPLGWLRALVQNLEFHLIPETDHARVLTTTVFSYAVMPSVLTMAVFWMVSAYVGLFAAVVTGLFLAVDFQSNLFETYGSDYYTGYLLTGCVLFALRARFSNPFRQMSFRQLCVAGLVTGFGVYLCRVTMMYALAFWVPWEDFWLALKRAFRPQGKLLRALVWIFWIWVALALYLEIFGSELGRIQGHRVALDAGPNWNLAELALVILLAVDLWPRIRREDFHRALAAGSGFLIGFWPDLWQQVVHQHQFPRLDSPTYSQSFEKSLWIISQLPSRFRDLVSADSRHLASVGSVCLGLLALWALVRRARTSPGVRACALGGLVTLAAFIRIRTFNTSEAPIRYLLPIFPALLLGLGCLWDEALRRGRELGRWGMLAAVLVLASVHLGTQGLAHERSRQEILASGQIQQLWEMVDRFRKASVEAVLADDYWVSLTGAFFSNEKPFFIYKEKYFVQPFFDAKQAAQARFAGYVTSEEPKSEIIFRDKRWTVKESLGTVGPFRLYTVIAAEPSSPPSGQH